MNELEIRKFRQMFYSALALVFILFYVSISVMVNSRSQAEVEKNDNIGQLLVDMIDIQRNILLDEFITSNLDSSESRLRRILDRLVAKKYELYFIRNSKCLSGLSDCQKLNKQVRGDIDETSLIKHNNHDLIVVPFHSFGKEYGRVIVKIKDLTEDYFWEIVLTTSFPFLALVIIWFFAFKRYEEKIIVPIFLKIADSIKHKEKAELSEKVFHDIQSPLLSLKHIKKISKLDEKVEKVFETSINRLEEVSNKVLSSAPKEKSFRVYTLIDLYTAIERLVMEKELLCPQYNFIVNAYNISGDKSFYNEEFQEIILSVDNLLKNSIEACSETKFPTISVSVLVNWSDKKLVIDVTDNGHGIPDSISEKILSGGATTKPNGHGIGVSGSVKALEKVGFLLALKKTGVKGTSFQISSLN